MENIYAWHHQKKKKNTARIRIIPLCLYTAKNEFDGKGLEFLFSLLLFQKNSELFLEIVMNDYY